MQSVRMKNSRSARQAGLVSVLVLTVGLLTLLAARDVAAAGNGSVQRLTEVATGEVELNTGRIIVAFAPGTSGKVQADLHARHGGRVVGKISGLGFDVIAIPDAAQTQVVAAAYSRNSNVTLARPDALVPLVGTEINPDATVVPDDVHYPLQWQHQAINSPEAWAVERGESSTLITICDTGVSPTHPDLIPNLRGDLGRNFAGGGNDWSPIHYHGTSVAGAAAAAGNNGIGVTGVSWNAGIVPVRVSNRFDGAANLSAIAKCIEYGADQGSAAINVSYTTYTNDEIDPVILAAGVYADERGSVLVIAAGNSNRDAAPGFDPDSILYVAATNDGNGKASFSNFGSSVDIAAPGDSVVTTYSELSCGRRKCNVVFEDYVYVSGTSFAAPIVAGAVALTADALAGPLAKKVVSERASFLRDAIVDGACDLGVAGDDDLYGAGLLSVHDSVHGQSCSEPIPLPVIEAVLVSPIFVSIYVGGEQQFSASAIWSDGSSTDVTTKAKWASSNDLVAAFDAAGATGLASGMSAGMATMSATYSLDSNLKSGSIVLFVTEPPPVGTIASVTVGYSTSGGRGGTRNLTAKLTVTDDSPGDPVEGAMVTIWLFNLSTGGIWNGTAPTATDGTVDFTLKNAPSGTYTTIVTAVQADGLVWDGITPENELTK